jgi:hypothetical protein
VVVESLNRISRTLPLPVCAGEGAGCCAGSDPFEDAVREQGYTNVELAVAQVLAYPLSILKLASSSKGLVLLCERLELDALPEELRVEVRQLREMLMELVTEAVKCSEDNKEEAEEGSGLRAADLLVAAAPLPPPS